MYGMYTYWFIFLQHGVFNENEMKFYAAEVILGLEHMHRLVVIDNEF